jgi:hypothetical protein
MLDDYEQPRLVEPRSNKLRFQLAALLAVIGAVLMFMAVRFEQKNFLTSKPGTRRAVPTYSRMWFDDKDTLTGVRLAADGSGGSTMTMERWSSQSSLKVDLPGLSVQNAENAPWIVAPDRSRVYWVDHTSIRWSSLAAAGSSASGSITIPGNRSVLSLGVLSNGSVIAALSDGSIGQWDVRDGSAYPLWQSQLPAADQAVTNGDYLAFGSEQSGRALLYHFRDPQGWTLAEDTPVYDTPYRLILPAPGIMAQLATAGLRVDGKTRNSPGVVRSAVAHLDEVLASGDFDGIVVLSPDDEAYPLAPAAAGSLLAVGDSRFAVSGPAETVVFDLGVETRLTKIGRRLSYVSFSLFTLAVILVLGKFLRAALVELAALLVRPKGKNVDAPLFLPGPPAVLVDACAREEAILWAGAGLSAQSGLPVRQSFIRNMLQEAAVEHWADAELMRKLMVQAAHDHESALDELVASSTKGEFRHTLAIYFRSSCLRFARPSRSHELLANIPFAAAITTNYDHLLRQLGLRWDHDPITLQSMRPPDLNGAPFIFQIYGDPETPRTMFFSRADLRVALAKAPAAEILRRAFENNNLMFVGCSLDGLLADLHALRLPGKPSRQHFAVAGVSGPEWHDQVARLRDRYGIEVLACAEEKISAELPDFLYKLSREVDQVRGIQRTEAPQIPIASSARAR